MMDASNVTNSLKPLHEARAAVLDAMARRPPVEVAIGDALDRVTAAPVVATEAVPPFANSAMDGFAVRSADIDQVPTALDVIEDVPAGSVPTRQVGPGQATRIMTGAPMPGGADAIVMVEDTSTVEDSKVEIRAVPVAGAHIRPAGGDIAVGDVVVDAGVRLTARHLASIASAAGTVAVAQPPVVAIMSTGDEVVPPDTATLEPGMIRDTNRVLVASMLDELRIPTIDLGIIGDDLESLRSAYRQAAEEADLIISTGGVSMGDYDFVKQILGETGSVEFWRVAMQPAKPFAFGSVDGVPLFGLPGNPVSTFVAYEQFVRPALLHMMGATKLLRPRIAGTMGEDVVTSDAKEVFLRVLLAHDDGGYVALKSGAQGSNVLSALANADAFAVVPVGEASVSAGEPVMLEMFTWDEDRTHSDD
ncbi:MAG: molybdopterin molybdotransferase MoeA [Acidimicrobiia bacterium]